MGGKHCGKRRKCWLPAFSKFSKKFSKALFIRVIKTQDCLARGYTSEELKISVPLTLSTDGLHTKICFGASGRKDPANN